MRYAALVGNGDLAIEYDRAAVRTEAPEWLAEERRAIMAIAAEELQRAASGYDRDQPVTVVLDLMQPADAIRRLSAGRHDLEADIGRQIGRHRPRGKLIGIRNKCPDPGG